MIGFILIICNSNVCILCPKLHLYLNIDCIGISDLACSKPVSWVSQHTVLLRDFSAWYMAPSSLNSSTKLKRILWFILFFSPRSQVTFKCFSSYLPNLSIMLHLSCYPVLQTTSISGREYCSRFPAQLLTSILACLQSILLQLQECCFENINQIMPFGT